MRAPRTEAEHRRDVASIVDGLFEKGVDLRGYEDFLVSVSAADAAAAVGIPIKDGEIWLRGAGSWFLASNKVRSLSKNSHHDVIDVTTMSAERRFISTGLVRNTVTVVCMAPAEFEPGVFDMMFTLGGITIESPCRIDRVELNFEADAFTEMTVEIELIDRSQYSWP